MLETYAYIAIGLGLTAFGAFLHYLIAALLERGKQKTTTAAMEQELREEVLLNIAKLDQLAASIPEMEKDRTVPVYLPYRMSLTTLRQAISSGQLRLISIQSQRRWRMIAEICESFNSFVDNTELIATICLLHSDGLPIVRYRHQQLANQSTETKQSIERILTQIPSSIKNEKRKRSVPTSK